MDETKRLPTEMEVQALLRNAARRAEDEATIANAASGPGARPTPREVLALVTAGLFVLAFPFFFWEVPEAAGFVAVLAWPAVLVQNIQVGRLQRAVRALARTAERASTGERAPGPPGAPAPSAH